MSQYLAELCALLVEDTLGAFFAHLFSTLATNGRLAATQLAQTCRLPLRQIRHGLSVLIQAQLIYHHTSSDGRSSYEANLRAAYDLVRSGKIICLVKEGFGNDAATVVTHLLLVGQSRIKDIRRFWQSQNLQPQNVNGDSQHGHATRPSISPEDAEEDIYERYGSQNEPVELCSVLKTLLQHGVILRVRAAHFHTPADNYFDAENRINASEISSGVKGRKGQEILGEKIMQEMATQNDASISVEQIMSAGRGSLKRPVADDHGSSMRKKTKLTNGSLSNIDAPAMDNVAARDMTAENIVIRVNHDKVAAMLRNSRLVHAARKQFGRHASEVYAAVLQQFSEIPYRWQTRSEPAPEEEGVTDLDLESCYIDLRLLLKAMNPRESVNDDDDGVLGAGSDRREVPVLNGSSTLVNGHVNGNYPSEQPRPVTLNDIKSSLTALAQGPYSFVAQDPDSPRWIVDFQELSKQLRREEALRLAGSRLNSVALRLIRVLLDKGKLDEKFLQEISLLSAKDLRQCLAKLKTVGFIGLQEVPREPQRQPNRTMFLWFYDADRVRKMLLGDLYKTMSRLFKRLRSERIQVGAVLEKSERTDVKGQEDKLMASGEIDLLNVWRSKEEWLLVELNRLDDSVAVLRDI